MPTMRLCGLALVAAALAAGAAQAEPHGDPDRPVLLGRAYNPLSYIGRPDALHDLPSSPKVAQDPPDGARLKVQPSPPDKSLGGPDTKSLGGPDTKPNLRGYDKTHRLAR